MNGVYGTLAIVPLALVASSTALAQDVVPIRDAGRCKTCEIVLEHVVTLGDREGPGQVAVPSAAIVRDSKGNYYVAHSSQVFVFDPAGTFLRTFGRRGDGPGEYKGIGHLRFRAGDTLEIYSRARRTVLAPDLSVVSTNRVGVSYLQSVFLGDARAVVNHPLTAPGRIGYPLQLVNDSGQIVRSFGVLGEPHYRSGEPLKLRRPLAPGPDEGSVWSVGRADYLIELWDTTGARLAALQRDVDWFEPHVLDRFEGPNGPPPQPGVSLVTRGQGGRLWLTVFVPAENWRDAYTRGQDGGWEVKPESFAKLWDTRLEVVDPSVGQLVVSRLFRGTTFVGFLGDDGIVSYREDEMGYPFLDVWRMSVTGNPLDRPRSDLSVTAGETARDRPLVETRSFTRKPITIVGRETEHRDARSGVRRTPRD